MSIKIIVRYPDGMLLKGTTADFFPNKSKFHLIELNGSKSHEIEIANIKAVYFVKSFEGKKGYAKKMDGVRVGMGRKIKVHFKDGETLIGYTQTYSPSRDIFIVFPADAESNNEKVVVVTKATDNVEFL